MKNIEMVTRALRSTLARLCAMSILIAILGCGTENTGTDTSEVTVPAPSSVEPEDAPKAQDVLAASNEIDIGDVSYGVYALIRYAYENSAPPNISVAKLSSPRFDNRIQLLTLDIAPDYPSELDFVLWLGGTRPLTNHAVDISLHVYRQYVPVGAVENAEVVEEILTVREVLGDGRGVLTPFQYAFDPLSGLESIPDTMLVYAELDATLYLHTSVESFDPENPGKEATDSVRYNGFNPARINFLGGAQE